jgi:hypothetical protein
MATFEQEQQSRETLQQVLGGLSDFTASELARTDLPSDLSFQLGVVYFDRIIRLFKGLRDSDLADIPYNTLQNLNVNATAAFTLLQEIREFSVTKYQNNPIAQRDAIMNRARDQYDGWFQVVAPVVAFTVRKGVDFERLENQAKQLLERIEQIASNCDRKLNSAVKESEEALAQVRAVAQEAGVSQHAIHFKNEAELNEKSAKPWLKTTTGLAIVTVLLGLGLIIEYIFRIPNLTPSQSLQMAIPKLFVFSVLLSATVWCGRTYRAYRHNAVVNRHRRNALATFQTFAEAAGDKATKDAVLLQATQCIFSQQPTGYIQAEPEPTALPISEMMKAVGK